MTPSCAGGAGSRPASGTESDHQDRVRRESEQFLSPAQLETRNRQRVVGLWLLVIFGISLSLFHIILDALLYPALLSSLAEVRLGSTCCGLFFLALMKWLSRVTKKLGVARHVYVVGGAIRNFVIDQPI